MALSVKAISSAIVLSGLIACAGTEPTARVVNVAFDPNSNLGSADPSPAFVAQVFDTVCLKTRPTYQGADAALTSLGFAPAGTGTYFDGRHNMSVKLLGTPANACSIVWGVANDPADHLTGYRDAMMAREPLDLSTASFRTTGTRDGVTYFNTRSTAN